MVKTISHHDSIKIEKQGDLACGSSCVPSCGPTASGEVPIPNNTRLCIYSNTVWPPHQCHQPNSMFVTLPSS